MMNAPGTDCNTYSNVPFLSETDERNNYNYSMAPPSAPPSYGEVFPTTNYTLPPPLAPGTSVAKLTHADWVPRCLEPGSQTTDPVFEPFDHLISYVNQWLSQNPCHGVKTVEVLERKVNDQMFADTVSTFHHQASHGRNIYVKGLRVWLEPRVSPSQPPDQIGMLTVFPEHTFKERPLSFRLGYPSHHMGVVGGGFMMPAGINNIPGMEAKIEGLPYGGSAVILMWPVFESLDQMIEKMNTKLKESPLPGKLVSIETDRLRLPDGAKLEDILLDPECSCWVDSNDAVKIKLYVRLLRLFYIQGSPVQEEIGIKDFPADVLVPARGITKARLADYNQTLLKAGHWAYGLSQMGNRILNVKTLNFKQEELLGQLQDVDPQKMDHEEVNTGEMWSQRVIRVAYTLPLDKSTQGHMVTAVPVRLSTKSFIPEVIDGNAYQTMPQLMGGITNWLDYTGARVLNAETYMIEKKDERKLDQMRVYTGMTTGKRLLTVIRLFLDGDYQDLHVIRGKTQSSGCNVL